MTSKQQTLLDLPISIANQVLEKLEPVEILTCQKVCRSIRSAIDKNVHFNEISIKLWNHSVSFYFDKIKIIYRNAFNGGSYMEYNGQQKTIEGVNYIKAAFTDLKILLKHVSELCIYPYQVNRQNTVNFFVDVLKEDVNIHVETITLIDCLFDDVLLILPLFNCQTLKEISLRRILEIDQLKKITYLDQWKNTKIFTCWDSFLECPPIEYFFHFEEFTINTHHFPIQNAIKVRDDLLQRCTFQEFTITILHQNLNPVEFAKIFQPDYAGLGYEFTLEYSNGKSKFKINLEEGPFPTLTWYFEIKRC